MPWAMWATEAYLQKQGAIRNSTEWLNLKIKINFCDYVHEAYLHW